VARFRVGVLENLINSRFDPPPLINANEPYGVDWSKPVARFEDGLATIRALWGSKGELVSRESPYFPLRHAVFDIPPYKGRWPEIWIAAHGPRMLRATCRYADAWFPAFLFRPQDYSRGLAMVRAAASDAGRDPLALTPAVFLAVLTGRSRDDVDCALKGDAAKMYPITVGAEMWSRHGAVHPLGADFTGLQDFQPQTLDEQTALSYTAQVPPSLMEEIYLTGTPDEIIEQAAVWRDHGVRYAVVVNACGRRLPRQDQWAHQPGVGDGSDQPNDAAGLHHAHASPSVRHPRLPGQPHSRANAARARVGCHHRAVHSGG
jgi:alkanesulfonate monooxygenase SsuD/methylene tetrahydromethanopterin reductase-like flavin-dependent oxidoreductase (luciferase family)